MTPTSPTPQPTARPTLDIHTFGYTIKKEHWSDVDLNCDGLDERLVKIRTPSLTLGLILQVPYQSGYRQAWEYTCPLSHKLYQSQDCLNVEGALLAINDCEQLVTFLGRYQGENHLLIFRWDGQEMSLVLDTLATSYAATQDPLVLTATLERCDSQNRCDKRNTAYLWNGTEFAQE
jgi:hypothetical protein